jgi:hypothetical protein
MTAMHDHQAHLTLEAILAKLRQVERLMNINEWTDQANRDYYELFGVDKNKEAVRRNKSPVKIDWKRSHRLQHFSWDEACEYPLPSSEASPEQQPVDAMSVDSDKQPHLSSTKDGSTFTTKQKNTITKYDKCAHDNLIRQFQRSGLLSGFAGKTSKQGLGPLLE